jgi:arylformamidase
VFPGPRERAPIHVFFHGGYWRVLSAREFSFLAEAGLARGWCTVIVNYALCPQVKIPEIVRQARAAISWTWHNASKFDGDRERIVVSGHSAGGQLVGRLLATEWARDYGMPVAPIRAAMPISGLFDLEPLRWSWLQPGLQLNTEEIRAESPLHHLPTEPVPMVVAVGGAETQSFKEQSKTYCAAVKERLLSAEYLEAPQRHHFDVLDDLALANGILWERLEALLG